MPILKKSRSLLFDRIYRKTTILVLFWLCGLAPFVAGVSFFVPVIMHYQTKSVHFSDDEILSWVDYASNNIQTLREFSSYRVMGVHGLVTGEAAVRAAEDIKSGRSYSNSENGILDVQLFDPQDILGGDSSSWLSIASLQVSDIFLEAYLHSGQEEYLNAAKEYALDFARVENTLLLPRGYIWNDHAMALRSILLGRLLTAIVSSNSIHDLSDIRDLLTALDKLSSLLSDASHFTFRSNHGLMQSMAVMHAAIVAPNLPGIADKLNYVVERIDGQIKYLVSEDGVITEHSPGYHIYNLGLLAVTLRYMDILERPIPTHWIQRYEAAKQLYQHLIRPDGTVPRHGDTDGGPKGLIEAKIAKDKPYITLRSDSQRKRSGSHWLSEDFGYWSEWRGSNHLSATWANFASQAHKHADDMSMIFWWGGEEWWTSVGYWPYGNERRSDAIGWNGSNAPHYREEPTMSRRSTNIEAWFVGDDVSILHLRRMNEMGYEVDRQIVNVNQNLWIVVDAPSGLVAKETESVWQLPSSAQPQFEQEENQLFRFLTSKSEATMDVQLLLGPGASYSWSIGSENPFAGWVVERRKIRAANAVILSTPPGAWSGVSWRTDIRPYMPIGLNVEHVSWKSSEHWSMRIAAPNGYATIIRNGNQISYESPGVAWSHSLMAESSLELLGRAESAFHEMEEVTPQYRDFLPWRIKVLRLAIIAGMLQLLLLVGSFRWMRRHMQIAIPSISILLVTHIALVMWIHVVYFAP